MPLKDILNVVITDENESKTIACEIKNLSSKQEPVSKSSRVCNFDDDDTLGVPRIKVIGVGGAGNNIIDFLENLRS
jgi:cell division GTPase FtsZ